MHVPSPLQLLLISLLLSASALPAQRSLTVAALKDNTLYNQPDGLLSNGTGQQFFVGRSGFNNPAQTRRGVIDFDLAGVPAGSQVLSVELRLQMTKTSAAAFPISLHRILQDWGEGDSQASGNEGGGAPSEPGDATWLHSFFPNAFWTTPGGDFVSAASASTVVAGLGAYTWGSSPELVADVQSWVDDPSSAHGWLLLGVESEAFTAKRFASRQNFDASIRPELVVSYLPAASTRLVGMGCLSSSMLPSSLQASGLPVIGAADFRLEIAGGARDGIAFIFFSFFEAQSPLRLNADCFFYLDLLDAAALVSSGASPLGPLPLSSSGFGSRSLPIPDDASIAGSNVFVQALILDPAVVAGFSSTNALEIVVGH